MGVHSTNVRNIINIPNNNSNDHSLKLVLWSATARG